MAGEIKFVMQVDTASGEMNLARAAQAFQNVGTAASTASKRMQDVGHTSASAMDRLQSGSRAAANAGRALSQTLSTFGGVAGGYIAGQIGAVTNALEALKQGAVAAGLSISRIVGLIGAFGPGLLGLVAIMGIGREFRKGVLSDQETLTQLKDHRDKLLALVQTMFAKGALSKSEAINLQVGLTLREGTVEELFDAVRKAQTRLRDFVRPSIDLDAFGKLEELAANLRAKSLKGKDRAVAEFEIEIGEMGARIQGLAQKAGVDPKNYRAALDAFIGRRFADIDELFAAGDKQELPRAREQSPVTALERMGAVLSGLGRGFGGTDPMMSTARNTSELVSLTRQLLKKQNQNPPELTNE